MPTPFSAARLCLAGDAAAALDAAVAAAHRRRHAQTTSLHVVFALLSPSSLPLLRDAVSRARSSAYSPRLQFKALELCFGVALDRLPSSPRSPPLSSDHHPPISNSLMAAIKRSQAHQRRNPDSIHIYQNNNIHSSSSSSTFSGVKVELQQLVMAILDDPVVSRVFGESGFRSCDIKIAVLRPLPPVIQFPARCPPLFLCNFSAPEGNFPFPLRGQLCSDGGDENSRRIGEILARQTNCNPVLVGVGAGEAYRGFILAVEKQNWSILPHELHGLKLISLEIGDGLLIRKQLEELGNQAEEPRVVVSVGDLKELVEGRCDDAASCLVTEMTRVLEVHHARIRVMGWSATYEAYMKFLSLYPLLDKDWDLQLLPITSLKPVMGGLLQRTQSLKESFIPFEGFSPIAYKPKSLSSMSYQSAVRCQLCNDSYEQEIIAILKGSLPPVEDPQPMSIPTWLQKDDIRKNSILDSRKAKDDRSISSANLIDLQKKWNDNCQRLHRGRQVLETDNFKTPSHVIDLPYVSDKERASIPISNSLMSASESKDKDLISKLQMRPPRSELTRVEDFLPQQGSLSPSSETSVATDLVLGTLNETPHKEQVDPSNFKAFYASLIEKVGRQEEALCAISEAIVRCRAGRERRHGASLKGDIWLGFIGHDRVGKKKVAMALAELMFGSRESFICIDFGSQGGLSLQNTNDVSFWGKTILDHIAEELCKNPCSVVFLENIEKADLLVQSNLSRAINTGKLSNSHGREFSINSAVFVTTTGTRQGKAFPPGKESVSFSEERILAAQGRQMKILLESVSDARGTTRSSDVSMRQVSSCAVSVSKHRLDVSKSSRKRLKIFLDLNLPVEEAGTGDADYGSDDESNSIWVEEFFKSMDETIDFRPFNFDAFSDHVLKEISKSLYNTIGYECVLEIDVEVMEQILAATWLLEDSGEFKKWSEKVLAGCLMELRRRYGLSARTVLRLIACEGTPADWAPGIFLPSRIIIE